jgi:hypothetical protein
VVDQVAVVVELLLQVEVEMYLLQVQLKELMAVETVAETLMIMVPVAVVAHKVQECKYLLAYLFLIW